jgi:hypothetical protein
MAQGHRQWPSHPYLDTSVVHTTICTADDLEADIVLPSLAASDVNGQYASAVFVRYADDSSLHIIRPTKLELEVETDLLYGQVMAGDGSAHGGFVAGVGGARCLSHHAGLHVIARPTLHLRIPANNPHFTTTATCFYLPDRQ